MHVGAPLLVTSRCDGFRLHRLQVPGDIKIVPAGYSRIWETEGPTLKLTIDVSPSLVRTAAEEMSLNADRVSIAPQLHVRDPQIEYIAWALKAELETEEPFGRLYADSLGLALAAHLLRRYAPSVPDRFPSALPKRRLQRVLDYIRDHLSHDLTLGELAAIANMSPSYFNVLFKQSVGLSVHQHVVRVRVEYATALILEGDLPLSEVAFKAGFANQSHMARCMRRITGVTPGALRRNTI
ncbi:MAG: helix-turn-helix transcriptional regulator [Candidatus Eremiobacteraeota bacterium]|nr:helix-turn-helix transcriptional regulator [Candidatus Eremiobacteraeota bacterium]